MCRQGLLHAFFMLADSNSHVYLILKMQHGLYAALANVEAKIRELEELGSADFSGRADISARVFYVTQDLTPAQMAALYNLADAYVTPYHAEAFNMPALEAAACGVPLIVPSGGPTDDFVYAPSTVFIPTVVEALHEHNQVRR